jgi:ferredoxin--NADP+ reductase
MLATGTGLGPFVAMLRSEEVWQRFERVVVAHGVRALPHLGFADELRALAQARPGGFLYLPLVTRDPPPPGGHPLRIPAAISGGQLEQRAELPLDAASCHVMLCGNPHMIDDAQAALRERGLVKHRKRAPGHVTIESYW